MIEKVSLLGSSNKQKGEAGRPVVPWELKGEPDRPVKGEAGRDPEMKEDRERKDPHRLPAINCTWMI